MKVIRNKKTLGLMGASLGFVMLTGCATQTQPVEELQAQIRASERAFEDCQARVEAADERVQRAESRADELRLRAEELERRMARMEARMTGKG